MTQPNENIKSTPQLLKMESILLMIHLSLAELGNIVVKQTETFLLEAKNNFWQNI